MIKAQYKKAAAPRPQFGSANPIPEPVVVTGKRLIAPKDLPLKGILYNINHLRRMWTTGKFPPPVYTSPRRFAWREADLDEWIETRVSKV
jgi:Prophage CP4-57 regulatory protein (AlpA)